MIYTLKQFHALAASLAAKYLADPETTAVETQVSISDADGLSCAAFLRSRNVKRYVTEILVSGYGKSPEVALGEFEEALAQKISGVVLDDIAFEIEEE